MTDEPRVLKFDQAVDDWSGPERYAYREKVGVNPHFAIRIIGRAFDDAATQHTVQLLVAGGAALDFVGFDVGQHRHFGGGAQRGKTVLGFALLRGYAFNEAVPSPAGGALAEPFGAGTAAIGADELGFFFGHEGHGTG